MVKTALGERFSCFWIGSSAAAKRGASSGLRQGAPESQSPIEKT